MIRHRVWQTLALCALACLSTVVIAQEESETGQPPVPGATKTEAAGDERAQPQAAQPGPVKPTLPPAWVDVLAVAFHRSGEHEWSDHRARRSTKRTRTPGGPPSASGGLLKTTNNGIYVGTSIRSGSDRVDRRRAGGPVRLRISCGWGRVKRIRATVRRGATVSTSRPTGARPGRTWG